MTTRNSTTNGTTRRAFLGALAGAAPLALAGAATPAKPAEPLPPEYTDEVPHSAVAARHHLCDCPRCADDYNAHWCHPLVLDALTACTAATAALDRLYREHCDDAHCATCRDADAYGHVVYVFWQHLESTAGPEVVVEAQAERAAVPDRSQAPHPAAVVALYDFLDALLDLTAGHCQDRNCEVCDLADRTAYFVDNAVHLLTGEGLPREADRMSFLLAVGRRELGSAERKVARLRRLKRQGGPGLPPHSAALHYGARRSVQSCREHLALLTEAASRRGKTT